jgi:hypothetical protein
MQLRLSHAAVVAAMACLSACATPIAEHIPLAASAHASIASTELVVPIKQSEVYVFVPASTAGASAGLLGALVDVSIDATRNKNAETAVTPLRDAMVDFDADTMLRDDLKASLSQIDWLHVSGARVVKDIVPATLDKAITDSKDAAVLIVAADYHLSNDGAELDVVLSANMYANSDGLASLKPKAGKPSKSDISNAIYRNSVTFKATAPGATGERTQNIAAWSANNGAALRAAMHEGSNKLAGQIASDLAGEMTAMGAAPKGWKLVTTAGR